MSTNPAVHAAFLIENWADMFPLTVIVRSIWMRDGGRKERRDFF